MKDVIVIRGGDVESTPNPGASGGDAGWTKRILYPPRVVTKGLFFGIAEINPGYSPHRWHRHVTDKSEGYEAIYADETEALYYIIKGSGVAQWKTDEGGIREEKVSAGDTVFFPADVAEHQVLNSGAEKMLIVLCGQPTPNITLSYHLPKK